MKIAMRHCLLLHRRPPVAGKGTECRHGSQKPTGHSAAIYDERTKLTIFNSSCILCNRDLDAVAGRRLIFSRRWGPDAAARADAIESDGLIPWVCQQCSGSICPRCQSPLQFPMGRDAYRSDGSLVHVAVMPFDPGCINADCVLHHATVTC